MPPPMIYLAAKELDRGDGTTSAVYFDAFMYLRMTRTVDEARKKSNARMVHNSEKTGENKSLSASCHVSRVCSKIFACVCEYG